MLYESYGTQEYVKANIVLTLPNAIFVNQVSAAHRPAMPGFFKLILCGSSVYMFVCVYVCVCLCVCVSIPRLLITIVA